MTPPFPDFQTFRRLCMILQGFYCFSFAIELFLQQPLLVELFLQTLHIIHIKVNKYYQKLTLLFLRVTSLNVTSCADIFAKVCKSTTNQYNNKASQLLTTQSTAVLLQESPTRYITNKDNNSQILDFLHVCWITT